MKIFFGVNQMNTKVLNVSRMLLSILIILDLILITFTIVSDVPPSLYDKILIFDVFTCIILLFDFFRGFFKADDRMHYLKENWLELIASIPFDIILSPFMMLSIVATISGMVWSVSGRSFLKWWRSTVMT